MISPQANLVWNSDVPLSLNDGSIWAGRGLSVAAQGGARAAWGPLTVTVAPEIVHIENRDTPVIPSDAQDRSAFASPWHSGSYGTADLPLRFGNENLTLVTPGQSSVTVRLGPLAAGGATENHWWGPGIRNAIVLSNNAQGFPHLFARTSGPLRTPIGELEWRWIAGILSESLYFDRRGANDNRSLSGFAATYSPGFATNLAIGVARAVVAPLNSWTEFIPHATDVLVDWKPVPSEDLEDPNVASLGSDQILSLFARYVLPTDGLELYGEWAYLEVPRSFRDFLTLPQHSRGHTLGLQYLADRAGTPLFRLQAEITSLEKSSAARQRPSPTFYLGRSTTQGYTHRGQVLGAAIGPGASSQWLAIDAYLHSGSFSVGAIGGRIRWENDTFYTRPLITRFDHDVSVLAGVRASARTGWGDLRSELLFGRRFNYLFQNRLSDPVRPREAVDLNSISFKLSVAPL